MKKLVILLFLLYTSQTVASKLHDSHNHNHNDHKAHAGYETHTDQYINLDFNTNSILGDVLQHQTNICTVRSGSTGSQTSVFFRGTNSNHTLVTINGSNLVR